MKNNPIGYFTASMVLAYDCPRKYFYQYVEGWRPVKQPANLVFGSIVHDSIAEEFLNGKTSEDVFLEKWDKAADLAYSKKDTHESLRKTGLSLLEKIKETEVLKRVVAVEKSYRTELPDGTLFKGKVDMVYDDGKDEVLLDWKTSSSSFLNSRPDLDDQLTAYSMLSGIRKVAFGVLLKKKEPEVKFYHAERTYQDHLDYQIKVMKAVSDIESGFFFKKPSLYCGFCTYSPLCRKQGHRVEAELERAPINDRYEGVECEEAGSFA